MNDNFVIVEEVEFDLPFMELYKNNFCFERSFILDSSMPESNMSNYSIFGYHPFLWIESKNEHIVVEKNGIKELYFGNPLNKIKELLLLFKVEKTEHIPLSCGAVGYFSYDLCHHLEKLPRKAIDDLGLPDLAVGFYDVLVIHNHSTLKTYIVALFSQELNREETYGKIRMIKDKISNKVQERKYSDEKPKANTFRQKSNFTKECYCNMIETAKEYIRMGEIYQVNLSQRFESTFSVSPIELYTELRKLNPSPFSAFLDCGESKVLSSSPERFLLLKDQYIETRPIKGTFPRSQNAFEDECNKLKLALSEKDRAENLMIVDLLRNDLGKVCKIGSIKATELFNIETYATVHHMVSTVTGELMDGFDAIDCLKATFPGGSITGAPKIRAMQIIDELEPTCRSVYTGSIGYIGFEGNMDLNIAIRTIIIKEQTAYYQVGGGIVWDSEPIKEYEETLHKGLAIEKAFSAICNRR